MHLFNPKNPLTVIQPGMTWYLGQAGLCTQLTPIPPGFGTPSQNPATYSGGPSPGGPNYGAPGSGPFVPPFAPFPGGFVPSLTTFTFVSGSASYISPVFSHPSAGSGTLTSGGGIGGLTIGQFQPTGSFALNMGLFALESAFATNPFTGAANNKFWNKIIFFDHLGDENTVLATSSLNAHYGAGTTTYLGVNYWTGTLAFPAPSGGNGFILGEDVTVTVS